MSHSFQVQAKNIKGWEACELSADDLKLSVIPLGGRIISLEFLGEEFFFIQEEHAGESFDFHGFSKEQIEIKKKELGFRLWGGDKTWVAPQKKWSQKIPPLALDGGSYQREIRGASLILRSPLDPETGLQICREITIEKGNRLELKQSFYNHSQEVIEYGIWNVSQILRELHVYIPVSPEKIISYADEGDSEALLKEVCAPLGNGWTSIRCDEPLHFKYGALPQKGRILSLKPYRSKNSFLVMERLFDLEPKASYAHGASVEVYNSPTMNYAEVEVHAPLQRLSPGEKSEHFQSWHFRKANRDEIRKILSKKP